MTRYPATYEQALEYIACNDDPTNLELESIQEAVSTDVLAFIYGESRRSVAHDILEMRLGGDPETADGEKYGLGYMQNRGAR